MIRNPKVSGTMSTHAKMFAGWTLDEALQHCTDRQLISDCREAERQWRAAGCPQRVQRLRGPGRVARTPADWQLYNNRVNTRARLYAAFRALLSEGRLLAWGRREFPVAEPMPLPAAAWPNLTIANFRLSTIEERTKEKTRIFNVRIFPVLNAPSAVDLLDGSALVQAATSYVFDDPEVEALGDVAIAADAALEAVFKRRWWTAYGQRQWPLWIQGPEHCDEDSILGITPRSSPPEITRANQVLYDRIAALFGLLRDGLLVAEGVPTRRQHPGQIPRSVWSHADYAVDLEHGDLFIKNDQATASWDDMTKLWTALMLRKADGVSRPDTSNVANSTPRSSPSRRTEDARTAEQACEQWLAALMEPAPGARPHVSKSGYWAEAEKKWHDKLSKRAFDRAWAQARIETNADGWSRPGRPRKSAH